MLKGWSPFLLASVLDLRLEHAGDQDRLTLTTLKQPCPTCIARLLRMPPVVPEPTPEEAIADLNIVVAAGHGRLSGRGPGGACSWA